MRDHDLNELAAELADNDEYNAAMVVAHGDDVSDVGGAIRESETMTPAEQSVWLAALTIWHVAKTAQETGGTVTVDEVAVDAVKMLQSQTGENA